jgi:pimeloyl-ACP methyl ester carboxylesterase
MMPNFVLVHGAWHGGWCYRDTANELRARGHVVVTPTLTGVGERFHASSEAITLETHIRDVVGCIEAEELDEIVLCGHSYGGMVITGVADRMAERIKTLVYLDAFVPEHGDSCNGLLPKALGPEVAQRFLEGIRSVAGEQHSGMVAPLSAEMFNVSPERRDWVNRRCVPQALATFEMPILLSGRAEVIKRRIFILADDWDPSPFRFFARKYESVAGWHIMKMRCGHSVMVDMPNELAAVLDDLA